MYDSFIISQVFMFIAFAVSITAFQIKNEKIFRLMFVVAGVFAGIHFLLLSAYTAAAMVLIASARWLTSLFSTSKYWFWFYICLFCIFFYFTYASVSSLLPFVAVIIGTIAVFQPDQFKLRKINMSVDLIWIINNALIFSPIGIISHLLFLSSNIIGYIRIKNN